MSQESPSFGREQKKSTDEPTRAELLKKHAAGAVMGCVAVRARMISRALTNLYNEALRPYSLRITQRAILAVVGLREETTPKQLSKLMMIEASTVSRNIERMKSMGWLETKSTDDGRSHLIVLSEEGEQLLFDTAAPWEEAQQEARAMFGEEAIGFLCGAADQLWAKEQKSAPSAVHTDS